MDPDLGGELTPSVRRSSREAMPRGEIVRLGVVGSTQAVAFGLAEDGAADGTAVLAETQTAGRGRHDRAWHDVPGESLLLSLILRPRLTVRDFPKLSLTTAVAVAETIRRTTGVDVRLKWPNDVRVHGRKLAGILLESRITVEPIVVVGIGINLRQQTFAGGLAGIATSVLLEGGCVVDRDTMLETLLATFDDWRLRLEREGFAPVRERWLALSETIGRVVSVDGRSGVAVDLDADGALVLEHAGTRQPVVAGELIEPRSGGDD